MIKNEINKQYFLDKIDLVKDLNYKIKETSIKMIDYIVSTDLRNMNFLTYISIKRILKEEDDSIVSNTIDFLVDHKIMNRGFQYIDSYEDLYILDEEEELLYETKKEFIDPIKGELVKTDSVYVYYYIKNK